MEHKFKCELCRLVKTHVSDFSTGYGINNQGRKICYDCCAVVDRKSMDKTGRITLYLVKKDGKNIISNWPGTLEIPVSRLKTGRHNLARTRTDVWFLDHQNREWHGVHIGDWSQLCHCKRLKSSTT